MRQYLQARRLSLLRHHHHRHDRNIHTTPPSYHPNAAPDLPQKNLSLLSFISSTNSNPKPEPQISNNPHPHPNPHKTAPYHPLPVLHSSASQLSLPPSPLTSPDLTTARLRHKTPKPRPDLSALTPFQQKLRSNPYAQTLASPVRQCALTGARLPGEFLLGFGLLRHPVTGGMWHLPRLAAAEGAAGEKKGEVEGEDGGDRDGEKERGKGKRRGRAAPGQERILSSTHYLCSGHALGSIGSRRNKDLIRLVIRRWKDDSGVDIGGIVWREDMVGFVGGVLRRRLMEGFEGLKKGKRGGDDLVPWEMEKGWEGIEGVKRVGAVLWLAGGEDLAGERWAGGADGTMVGGGRGQVGEGVMNAGGPSPYAMLRFPGRCIPVYNLQRLLGEDLVQALQIELPDRLGPELTLIRAGPSTTKLQQDLWRLMGYLSNNGAWIDN